jgi:hypothetical protein
MRRLRSIVRAVAPIVVLAVLAVAAVLVARDAAAIRRAMERSDFAFKAQPAAERLWRVDTRLPLAEEAFGIDDDLMIRRALRAFAVDARREDNPYDFARPAFRAEAQATLTAAERSSDLAAPLRSKAANLVGVLTFAEAAQDPINGPALVRRSAADFRRAVRIHPGNTEAKYNLEFVLRLLQPGAERQRIRQNIPAFQAGRSAPGAAPSRPGHGY